MDEQREWFLNPESTPGEEAVKILETTAKALGCDTNFVDKGAAGLRGLTPVLKEVLWVKYCQAALLLQGNHS